MYSKNLKQGFGFYTVEEFVRINKREEIDTANYFFIVCVLGIYFQYIYRNKKSNILHNQTLYIAPNKIFRFVNNTNRENIVNVFSSEFYERSLLEAQMLNSELFIRREPIEELVPMPIKDMRDDV